jgi:hypothetical protein
MYLKFRILGTCLGGGWVHTVPGGQDMPTVRVGRQQQQDYLVVGTLRYSDFSIAIGLRKNDWNIGLAKLSD